MSHDSRSDDDNNRLTRRHYVAGAGTLATVGIAGCSGGATAVTVPTAVTAVTVPTAPTGATAAPVSLSRYSTAGPAAAPPRPRHWRQRSTRFTPMSASR